MGKEYLIDTNVIIIDYMGERFPVPTLDFLDDILNSSFFLSVVNKIELLGFKGLTISEEKQFENLISASSIIMLHNGIVEETIALRKRYSIKLPDAIIAASAISIDATLITSDLSDFGKITSLKLLNPHAIQ